MEKDRFTKPDLIKYKDERISASSIIRFISIIVIIVGLVILAGIRIGDLVVAKESTFKSITLAATLIAILTLSVSIMRQKYKEINDPNDENKINMRY